MKRLIFLFAFALIYCTTIRSQEKQWRIFRPDSLTHQILPEYRPPNTLTKSWNDTLNIIPGKRQRHTIHQKTYSGKSKYYVYPNKMPIVVPPDRKYFLIVKEPDSTVNYPIRNFGEKNPVIDHRLDK